MPTTFLTPKERERYQEFPDSIEESTLRQYFHLTGNDLYFISRFHGKLNRLAVAIQIGIIRYLGHLPASWQEDIDTNILAFVAGELKFRHDKIRIENYGKRYRTRVEHLQSILKYLGFRKWQPTSDEPLMERWLVEQGMEHDHQRYLLDNLCEKLRKEKIFRPAISALEELIAGIRELLELETYERLSWLWTESFLQKLDSLLETDIHKKITPHRWLCSAPLTNTPKEINTMLEKISFLKEIGVSDWDLSCLPENRKKQLANTARNTTNTDLKRFRKTRLYPMLVCLLRECLLDITDMILVMYAHYWQQINNKAKKAWDMFLLESIKSQQQAIRTMTQVSKMVLDENIDKESLRDEIYENLSKTQIQDALQTLTEKPFKANSYLSFLKYSYASIKQFTPNLLEKLDFKVAFTKDNFEKALLLVKDLQTGKKRKIPQDAPMNFMSNSWQKIVFGSKDKQQQNYELCVLSLLKDRLKSGDVYVNLSRKFNNLENLLIEKNHWRNHQEEICQNLSLPNLATRIHEKVEELAALLPQLSEKLKESSDIRLENDVLVVSPLGANDIPPSARMLQQQISEKLPRVSLVEIIQEVDNWIHYSKELENEHSARNPDHQKLKYAALFCNACNISIADLARSSELDYQSLWWVTHNYFSEENLKKANNILVNRHHKQWLSNYWGSGTFSSSDGQRFPTSGKIRNAQALPKYFGYGQGIGIYTHTADQYSQFGSQVISIHERDATYVLTEILANETDLVLEEHTTDTHGYTDLNFALFDLVGKSFYPRIKDLKNQRLYKVTGKNLPSLVYPPLKFTGTVDIDSLQKHADEMTRVAVSLMTGTVTPSMLISKLQAYPKQNNLMYVLQSYGQLIKTIFICKYLINQPLRKKINTQLNKGEQLHGLRSYLWFGGDGFIRKKQEHQQQITAGSLNLLTNIVIAWNTTYIQAILRELYLNGQQINEEDMEHISPLPFEHINRLGKYDFQASYLQTPPTGLRPFRS
jgi:TnpA family transposase